MQNTRQRRYHIIDDGNSLKVPKPYCFKNLSKTVVKIRNAGLTYGVRKSKFNGIGGSEMSFTRGLSYIYWVLLTTLKEDTNERIY